MLSSICAIRRCILAEVKFLSRLFTALNLLPSMATIASANRFSRRHSTTNWRHTLRIAAPLSLRKLAMVLKSGISRPVNHNEAEFAKVEPINEDLDHANRILRFNVVLQTRRQ